MGTWGPAAWDNDSAADWFADTFEKTKLREYVEETLNQDAEESPEEIRAAAYILVALGRNYIWPIDSLDKHLTFAIEKLESIKVIYAEEFPDFETTIDEEIEKLRSELNPSGFQ
jgi:hypothetical protein